MYQEACEATQVARRAVGRGAGPADVVPAGAAGRHARAHRRVQPRRAATSSRTPSAPPTRWGRWIAAPTSPLLRSVVRPPEDPATRARVADLRRRLAALKARYDAGRWKEVAAGDADARGRGARARLPAAGGGDAGAVGDRVAGRRTTRRRPRRAFVEAFWAADASRHDEVRADGGVRSWCSCSAIRRGTFEEAERWSGTAEAVLQRHRRARAAARVAAQQHRRGAATCAANGRRRCCAQQQALALKEKALGREHPDVGVSEGNIAIALAGLALQPGGAGARRPVDHAAGERPGRRPSRPGHAAQQPRRDPGRARAAPRGAAVVRAGARHLGARARPGGSQPGLRADRHRRQLSGRGRSGQRAGAARARVQDPRGARGGLVAARRDPVRAGAGAVGSEPRPRAGALAGRAGEGGVREGAAARHEDQARRGRGVAARARVELSERRRVTPDASRGAAPYFAIGRTRRCSTEMGWSCRWRR